MLPSSFQPPAVDPAGANRSRYPSWVLLDDKAYFADQENATTATATTSTGHDVKVTFCIAADPPAVSYFCVHCPQLDAEDGFTTEPQVVSSANDLVLLCFSFRTGPRSAVNDDPRLQYFVYKAAAASDGGNSSLRPVQYPPPGTRHSRHNIVLLPGDEDGSFFLADLSPKGGCAHYDLHVFSSETNKWSTTELRLPFPHHVAPRDMPSPHDKAISLGGTGVGWVDLWRGIVVCDDVLRQDPVLRLIPLPKAAFDLRRKEEARSLRDVAYRDGFINFVEIEHLFLALDSGIRGRFKTTENLD